MMRASSSPSTKAPTRWLNKLFKAPRFWRSLIQAAVFIAALGLPVGIFHMICPMGGIATLTRFFQQGLFLPKTGAVNLIILSAVLISTWVFGPVFCAWLCPMGSIQDWVRALAGKLGVKALRIPKKIDSALGYLRYLILALIIFATARSFNLVFINADPYYALFHFWTGEVAPLALAVLSLVLIASVFIQRPWCRWFCPLGAILSVLGRFSILKIHRPSPKCVNCGRCQAVCPVGLDPAAGETVTDPRCIRCAECGLACPPKLRETRGLSFRSALGSALALFAVFLIAPRLTPETRGRGLNEISATETGAPPAAAGKENLSPNTPLAELPAILGIDLSAIYDFLGLPEHYDRATKLIDIEDDFEEKSYGWIKEALP